MVDITSQSETSQTEKTAEDIRSRDHLEVLAEVDAAGAMACISELPTARLWVASRLIGSAPGAQASRGRSATEANPVRYAGLGWSDL